MRKERRVAASFPALAAELQAAPSLGAKPLVVLTAGRLETGGWSIGEADWARFRTLMTEAQTNLARLSDRGRQQIIPDCGHNIYLERPEAVLAAVREVLAAAGENMGRPSLEEADE